MSFIFRFLFFPSFCIFTYAIAVTDPTILPITNSLGVFYEVDNNQLLYEATAPVINTVRLPTWLNFLVLPEKVQNCSNSTKPLNKSSCQIFSIFNEISNQIQSTLKTTPHTFPVETTESTWGLQCNFISKHFSSSFISPAIVQKYMNFLRLCSDGMILEEPLIDDFVKLPERSVFEQLDDAWETQFFSKINESSNMEEHFKILLEAVQISEIESILTLGVTNFMAETIRWTSALAKCATGHIPDSIITPERFSKSLVKLQDVIDAAGYRFVITPSPGFLPVYFKSEHLTDCSISVSPSEQNGQTLDLIVRSLVPVSRMNSDWMHGSIKTFPFIANKSEVVFQSDFPLSLEQENYRFIYDNASKTMYSSDGKLCDSTKPGFCRVPSIWDSRRVVKNTCPMKLLSGELQLDAKNESSCNRQLHVNVDEFPGMPFLVKQGTHTFYLTGIRDNSENFDLSVNCMKSNQTDYYMFPDNGALKVELACGCYLQVVKLKNAVIKPDLDCSPTLNVSIINCLAKT